MDKSALDGDLSNGTRELPWLDWIRFGAALAVLVFHARQMTFVAYGDLPAEQRSLLVQIFFAVTRPGREAVLVFFVLSGFLVGGRVLERVANRTFDVGAYFIDRSTRLFLPLIPALCLGALAGLLVGPPVTLATFLGTALNVQGFLTPLMSSNGPLWSLAYEWWFYVLAGSLAAATINVGRAAAICVALTAVCLLGLGELELLVSWVLGALAYLWRPARAQSWLLAAIVGIAIFALVQIQFGQEGVLSNPRIALVPLATSTLLFSGATAMAIAMLSTIPPPAGRGRGIYAAGSFLASFSYSLYLTHYPLLWVALAWWPQDKLSVTSLTGYALRIAACLGFAVLMYWLFERHTAPLRRLVRHAFSRPTPPPA